MAHKNRKRRPADRPADKPAGGRSARAAAGEAPGGPPRRRGRLRTWAFRLAALVLAPCILVGLLEGGLRLAGYGEPTAFLVKTGSGGRWAANQKFGWRFFPPAIARSPLLLSFPDDKPPGTVRVFIFGSSAAAGTPNNHYHFGRILQAMLRQRHPGTRFEVVNTAMTAVNSHVIRPIARECSARRGDVFVVYMGNNEVVGPYGPGTVFAGFLPSRAIIRASIFVRGTRTGQLFGGIPGLFGAQEPASRWRGMEMFAGSRVALDDGRMEKVYGYFQANLDDICDAASDAGAMAVLCTVGTNLRDCAPFASVHRSGLPAEEVRRFQSLLEAGAALAAGGDHAAALGQFAQAEAIDGRHAELHFRMGRSLLAAGRPADARHHLILARDLDALRFRADTRINEAIRRAAAGRAGRGVHLVDFESLLAADPATPQGIPGEEWFYEHVHLRFEGNHALAAAVCRQMESQLPALASAAGPGGGKPADLPSVQQCAELVGWTPWQRWRDQEAIVEMTARAPFTGQLDHGQAQARRRQQAAAFRAALTADILRQAEQACRRAAEADADDPMPRDALAQFLFDQGRYAEAAEQWQQVLRLLPGTVAVMNNRAMALTRDGKLDEAVGLYRAALTISPGQPTFCRNLAAALSAQGKHEEAIAWYRKALAGNGEDLLAHLGLASLLAGRKEMTEAREHLLQAARLAGDDAALRARLAQLFERVGDRQLAVEQYDRAVQLAPGDVATRERLAAALLLAGRHVEAAEHYGRILEAQPTNAGALYNISLALTRSGRDLDAASYLSQALRLQPLPDGHRQYGGLLGRLGRSDLAIEQYRAALRMRPDWPDASADLAWELATAADPSLRRPEEALGLAQAAGKAGEDARRLDVLAAALGAMGQYEQAAATATRAMELAKAKGGENPLAAGIESRLALYRAGRAFIQPAPAGGRP